MKSLGEKRGEKVDVEIFLRNENGGELLVSVITMHDGENRLSPTFLSEYHEALDFTDNQLEQYGDKKAILCTHTTTKWFCNGVDLNWVSNHNEDEIGKYEKNLEELLQRLVWYPIPTVAVLGGHSFGGGFAFAAAHDYRTMAPSRGWIRVPAVDIGIVLPTSLLNLFTYKFDKTTVRDLILEGRKFDAVDALSFHLIDFSVGSQDADILEESIKWAAVKAKRGGDRTLHSLKLLLFPPLFSNGDNRNNNNNIDAEFHFLRDYRKRVNSKL